MFRKKQMAKEPVHELEFKLMVSLRQRPGRAWELSLATFFCFLCGVYAILYSASYISYISVRLSLIYFLILPICAAIWWIFSYGRKHIMIVSIAGSIAIIAFLLNLPKLLQQWKWIWITAFENPPALSEIDLTTTAILLTTLIAIVLFVIVFVFRKGWLFYFVSIPIVLLGPLFGNSPDLITILLFGSFHLGCCVLEQTTLSDGKKRKSMFAVAKEKAAAGSLFLLTAFFLISIGISYVIPAGSMDKLFGLSSSFEQNIQRISSEATSSKVDTGVINRGNNYPTKKDQLEVTTTVLSRESLYLKGFTGDDYSVFRWEEADESDFIEEIISQNDLQTTKDYYENRQFYFTQMMVGDHGAGSTITIRPLSTSETGRYVPYISCPNESKDGASTYSVYSKQDFLEVFHRPRTDLTQWYYKFEQTYASYAHETYLDVPTERIPRIVSLCQENPLTDIDNITDFILDTLHSRASYTLTPGVAPLDQDIAEYFLFESGQGYCQHFATAAVLMYRLYGIPARYVTGYVAHADQFNKQADGSYRAILKDNQAHAWVEIYLENIGWMPVEVTPAGSIGNEVQIEPVSAADGDENEKPSETFIESVNPSAEETEQQGTQQTEQNPGYDLSQEDQSSGSFPLLGWVLLILILISGIGVLLHFRRKRLLQQQEKYRADQLFNHLVEVLHLGNYAQEYDGTEPDFEKVLVKTVPQITDEEAAEFMATVLQEAFGKEQASEDKTKKAFQVYEAVCGFVYDGLKFYQKWYFKYWKVYR